MGVYSHVPGDQRINVRCSPQQFSSNYFFYFYLCMHAYMCTLCKYSQVRKECQIPWYQSYRQCELPAIVLRTSDRSLQYSPSLLYTYIHTTFSLCVCLSTHVEVRRQLTGVSSLSPTWVPEMKTQIIRCDGKSS